MGRGRSRQDKQDRERENMGVFIRRTAKGLAPYWFGLWNEDGKRHETSLCRWKGVPPEPGEKYGDADFEKSRGEAEALFKRIREGERSKEEEAALIRKIHASRYGGRVSRVKLAELAARWDALPHKADLTEGRRARVHSVLKTFTKYMGENFPKVTEAAALRAEHFKGFLDSIDESGVSARTWNDYLSILRGVLAKVDGEGRGFREFLVPLPKRAEATVHRRPFDGPELDAIFAAAKEIDPELFPVLVGAACTALRRGDICRLRWDAIDLAEGFVTVKTSKTGEDVTIPIFPPFLAVLEEAERKRKKGVPYVWPRIALAYARDADGLNRRLNRVLAAAGFDVPKRKRPDKGKAKRKKQRKDNGGKYETPEDEETAAALLEDGMERDGWRNESKAKARKILQCHFAGMNGKAIAEALGISRASVSEYLCEMEKAGKMALVSEPKRPESARATLAEVGDEEQRKQRGSLCGWHSFRTTFCTLALANGVPMEILRKITGHRTAEIVLKHYDRRGREAMKKAIGAAMPKAIAGAVEGEAESAEFVAVPATLAGLLQGATAEELEKVAKMLAKTGKAKEGRK